MKLYQIYDRVACAVTGLIMSYKIDAVARRTFEDWLKSERGPGVHAADFDLLYLGEQDDLGVITPVIPIAVAFGAQWIDSQQLSLVAEGGK